MKRFAFVVLWASLAFSQTTSHRHQQPPAGRDSASACGQHCGTERWSLKTLSDSDADSFTSEEPKEMTVSELITQRAPSKLPATSRVPFEKTLVKVHALLIGWKVESGATGDQDFHMVIADPDDTGKQMIVEVPSPDCQLACSSQFLDDFKANRDQVPGKLGDPAENFQSLDRPWLVTITGPAFFDFNHGQIGLAPNCLEIHPVVNIAFESQTDTPVEANPAKSIAHRCGVPAGSGGGGRNRRKKKV